MFPRARDEEINILLFCLEDNWSMYVSYFAFSY